jgi:hypothetical protein
MARRKTNAEVGPLGVWAYDSRDLLGLSVEQVIERLPTKYNPATLRKVEGGSAKPGRRMWRELQALYRQEAEAAGVTITPQPPSVPDEPLSEPDLVIAIRAQTEAISELAAQVKAMLEAQPAQAKEIGREVALAVLEATRAGALSGELLRP